MRYREGGNLDVSSVQDRRGRGGGRGLAVGGGGLGLVGILVVVLFQVLGGGDAGTGAGLGQGEQADNSALEQACDDSGDANTSVDCAVVRTSSETCSCGAPDSRATASRGACSLPSLSSRRSFSAVRLDSSCGTTYR